jgi:hypothetical protein
LRRHTAAGAAFAREKNKNLENDLADEEKNLEKDLADEEKNLEKDLADDVEKTFEKQHAQRRNLFM